MVIDEQVRKCVVFVAVRRATGEYDFIGMAFYVATPLERDPAQSVAFLITAKHVIDGAKSLGVEAVHLRINLKNGTSACVQTQTNNWIYHPSDSTVDVAALLFTILAEWDHLALPDSLFLTPQNVKYHELGVGDEVFVTGLFKHHHGSSRNIPICRVGNLAALDEEKVVTERCGPIDAYLIEARSIGGLSGSPVFVHFGSSRYIGGEWKVARAC